MVYSLGYRRPSHVSTSDSSRDRASVGESYRSDDTCISRGIPDALSFERIISGATCPPCTTRDFMNYLKYIEHNAENLQFFLWFKDYCQRFERLAPSEKVLSPEWTAAQAEAEVATAQATRRKKTTPMIESILEGTDFAEGNTKVADSERPDPFNDHSRTSSPIDRKETSEYSSSTDDDTTLSSNSDFHRKADQALSNAGMKWKPFTAQPFREEMTRIITIYIAVDGQRQLNLSGRERTAILHALQNTTHPSALRVAVTSAELSLRRQSHPNFIRWTICNGNRPRVLFARGLGVSLILVGIVAELLITLSTAGRAWRVLPIIAFLIGISTLIAAWKGMCVVLHGLHHRHLRPWELFADPEDPVHLEEKNSSQDALVEHTPTGSYEDKPWIAKYEKRNVIRKIFDRQVWVREPALRQIQDTIFVQSLLAAFVLSCIIVGIFCAVPNGGFF